MILNEEQRMLQDSVNDFLADNAPVEQLRQLRDSQDETGYSLELWRQLTELGLACAVLPEEYGGLGIGWLGMGAVMEACGTRLVASPLLSTVVIGASIIELAGNEAQKETLLPAIAGGELTLALALDESHHFAPLDSVATLMADGESWLLNGQKSFVIDGHVADKLIVVARTDGGVGDATGVSLVLVDRDQQGVNVRRTILMDGRNAAIVTLDNVKLNANTLIGEPGTAWPALEKALDRGTACLAAEMLGGAREAFNRTVEYLKEREQFDAKIGSFQALQHRAAQMFCQLEQCRTAVLNALQTLDNDTPDVALQVSMAKALANDCYKHVTNEAVQMHGGMGVTDELDIGLFLKRARVSIQTLGDSSYHRDRFATCMGF